MFSAIYFEREEELNRFRYSLVTTYYYYLSYLLTQQVSNDSFWLFVCFSWRLMGVFVWVVRS